MAAVSGHISHLRVRRSERRQTGALARERCRKDGAGFQSGCCGRSDCSCRDAPGALYGPFDSKCAQAGANQRRAGALALRGW
eukprot:scaffold3620_cov417-Prasinococcus_capsulatus_cf.AAC.3